MEEFRLRIFSKFSQADVVDGRKYPGTGLSLSKAMIEKMGDTIGFDSIAGQGATFYVDLQISPHYSVTRDAPALDSGN